MTGKGTGGSVSFDGEWLTIHRDSFMAAVNHHGRGELRLHIGQITGIDLKKPGLTIGRFTVVAPGTMERSRRVSARQHDPLTVNFQPKRYQEFVSLRDAVLAAIAARARPQQAAAPDVAGQLAHLAQLHAQGALTNEEFAAAKARLIGLG